MTTILSRPWCVKSFFPPVDHSGDKRDSLPVFKCDAVLAIPNIVMQPTLDEVQQAVNRMAQLIIGVSKVGAGIKDINTVCAKFVGKGVGEWISNFTSHFIMDVITYPCWD